MSTQKNVHAGYSSTLESVRQYYGEVLASSADLKTSACCTTESLPAHIKPIASALHPEVISRFYGCGSPLPAALEGRTVLDLGCGSGRDCYILSKLVGEQGHVIGIDMTESQLEVARRHQEYHRQLWNYDQSNIEFKQAYIEDLESAGIASNSVDVVISNCVLNLSPDKRRVFAEILRVLKPGGELYFSDVFASRRIPEELAKDPILLGECLGGALYIEDFRRLVHELGCADYRVVNKSVIALNDPEVERKIGMIDFFSVTIRAFKLDLEDRCEDYGQVAYYKGTLAEAPHAYRLDDHHLFRTGMPVAVCSNTAAMLQATRFSEHFTITGDTKTHYGLFDCGPTPAASALAAAPAGACC